MPAKKKKAAKAKAKPAAKTAPAKKIPSVKTPYTKAQLYTAISEDTGLAKKDVNAVFQSLAAHAEGHLKQRGPGVFTLPGMAKFTVRKKPATKARKGVNPFTGEEIMIKAKPASRVVKARLLSGIKKMAG